MSAFGGKADIDNATSNVRLVPKADIRHPVNWSARRFDFDYFAFQRYDLYRP